MRPDPYREVMAPVLAVGGLLLMCLLTLGALAVKVLHLLPSVWAAASPLWAQLLATGWVLAVLVAALHYALSLCRFGWSLLSC